MTVYIPAFSPVLESIGKFGTKRGPLENFQGAVCHRKPNRVNNKWLHPGSDVRIMSILVTNRIECAAVARTRIAETAAEGDYLLNQRLHRKVVRRGLHLMKYKEGGLPTNRHCPAF